MPMSVHDPVIVKFQMNQTDWSAIYVPHGAELVEVLPIVPTVIEDEEVIEEQHGELLFDNVLGTSLDLVDQNPLESNHGPTVLVDKYFILLGSDSNDLPYMPDARLVGMANYTPPNPEDPEDYPWRVAVFLAKAGTTIISEGDLGSGWSIKDIPLNTIYAVPVEP